MPQPGRPAAPGRLRLPGEGPGRRVLEVAGLALLFLAAAKVPVPSDRTFEAFFFWPAAAVSHTAFFILGRRAGLGILLGSLLLNFTSWLSWPYALGMALLQTLGPWVAWRMMVAQGCPSPNLGRVRDLLRWYLTVALSSALFSGGLGSRLVDHALHRGFRAPVATAFSWFLGDQVAILCLGPLLLLGARSLRAPATADRRPGTTAWEPWALGLSALLLLLVGHPALGLPGDLRLALPFALVLPLLWTAVRFGPLPTALGLGLLSGVFAFLHSNGSLGLPSNAFRFSQLLLLVLAASALVTAAAAEETRLARRALALRDLQAQRMEAVATLAGGLVHGFNNQLTVLLGNLDRLRLEIPETASAQALLGRLEEASDGMARTVQQLRALSRQTPLKRFRLPLAEAVEPFLSETRALPRDLRFSLDLEAGAPVEVDPELLRQALGHLLANSRDALQDRGHLHLRGWATPGWVHLAWEDDGPGMSPEVLARACDPYFTTRAHRQGMGLALTFSLARQMGGELTLACPPGRGVVAELRLPAGEASSPTEVVPPPDRRVHRVLLADDEDGILELTLEVLRDEGYEVAPASDGQAAWERFEAEPDTWDLAILDLEMPRLHGSEVARRMQALRPELPILFISGYSEGGRPGLLEPPHRRFLPKPFGVKALLAAIETLCGPPPDGR